MVGAGGFPPVPSQHIASSRAPPVYREGSSPVVRRTFHRLPSGLSPTLTAPPLCRFPLGYRPAGGAKAAQDWSGTARCGPADDPQAAPNSTYRFARIPPCTWHIAG